ncbi:flavin reductase family protein [Pseudonocardia hispaniensis]|uniref:Flavin reductase family protein n=1 Tax=Pseudonocardia hispaniensis TaxID=904933 RepID=A0ABW1IWY9_9PSEU
MRALCAEAVDPLTIRRAYSCFPSGVTAVCGLLDTRPIGLAASSFTGVSLDPPLASVCVQNTSSTWPMLRELPRLGVSVLGQDQEKVCRALAAEPEDRFTDTPWEAGSTGAVFIRDATAWLDCSIHDEVPAGDHGIVLLRIHAVIAEPEAAPLIFHGSRFRKLLFAG